MRITTAIRPFLRRNRCRTRRHLLQLNPARGFHFGPPIPAEGARNSDYNRFAERLELRYTGIKDWLFYAEGEWEEEFGNVDEFQSLDEEIPLDKDTNALGQKYTIGATWNPTMRFSLAGQYFHRIASYDEDVFTAQFPRLINQDWNVDDFNIRMTFRPKLPACMGTLALVTRYDFVHTSIDSQWEDISTGRVAGRTAEWRNQKARDQ